MTYKYLAVLDFEATCASKNDENWNIELQEIIEIPGGLISLEEGQVVSSFNTFVKPILEPVSLSAPQTHALVHQQPTKY